MAQEQEERLQQVVTSRGVLMVSKATPAVQAYGGPERVPKGCEDHVLYEVPGKSPVFAKPVPMREFSEKDQAMADDMAKGLPAKIQERGSYRSTLDAMSARISMENGLPPTLNEGTITASFERQHGTTVYGFLDDVRRERELNGMAEMHGQKQEPGYDPA